MLRTRMILNTVKTILSEKIISVYPYFGRRNTIGFSHVSDIVKMSKFSLRDKSLSLVRCVLLLSERIFRWAILSLVFWKLFPISRVDVEDITFDEMGILTKLDKFLVLINALGL
jgi:hypothetical protein